MATNGHANGHMNGGMNGHNGTNGVATSTSRTKKGLAQMLKGGVIMDVMNPEQAKIAEAAGACAVMALEKIPADIRAEHGVARMSDPKMIKEIQAAVSIPVMAKVRIGHFVEAQILEALEIDYIDESEVLTVADEDNHINKRDFKVPYVCGCRDLGEALRHIRTVNKQIKQLCSMDENEIFVFAKNIGAPLELVEEVRRLGRLPVVNFAAGGVATPADAALCMQP